MKWRHSFSFVLVAFFSLFFGSFIITNDSFAIQDQVITLTSSSDYPIFCDSTSPCSDYNYLIIVSDSSVPSNASITLTAHKTPSGSFYNLLIPLRSKYLVLDLDNLDIDVSNFKDFQITSYQNFSSGSITLTFTENFGQASGDISITSNGTYDVSSYATATVDVPAQVIQGDYHDDLVNIQNSIITCGAILLVLYFFYCIYRLIIKNSGVH